MSIDHLPSTDKYRLIKTLFSKKPRKNSFLVSSSMVLLCAVVSNLTWTQVYWRKTLSASQEGVFELFHWWQVFTTTFVHGDGQHLLSNSFMLFILGFFVFGYYGVKVYPFYALLGATLTNALTLLTYPSHVRLVGASGLVYFLAGFWLSLYIAIERQHRLGARFLRAFGVGLVILFPSSFEANVSYRAHAIGFLVGVVFAIFYFLYKRKSLRSHEVYIKTPEESEDDLV